MPTSDVTPGDLLWDNDPRSRGRCLKVLRVEGGYAHCVVTMNPTASSVGRPSKIRLDRIKPTTNGYRHQPMTQDPS